MNREWIGIYGRLLRQPKFRRLSDAAQLALVYVWLMASDQEPEATWPNRDALDDLLEFHDRQPAVDELIAARFLDVAADGVVSVHDWDEWQFAASLAGRRTWERHYMREWRRKSKNEAAQERPDRTEPDMTREDITGVDNGSPPVNNNDPFDAPEMPILAWLAQHGCDIRPGDGYHRKIVTAAERHGVAAILEKLDFLANVGFKNGDVKGFVFGAIDALDAVARPNLAEVARTQREAEEERAHQARLDSTRRNLAEIRGEST